MNYLDELKIKSLMENNVLRTDLKNIQELVGTVTEEQLKYVDYFLSDDIGIFMPIGEVCYYALQPEHTHPSYMIVFPFNNETSIKIDNKIFPAELNKLFVLSPDIPHQELLSDLPPRYITASNRSITEISYDCGFANSSYLSSCFIKRFKITPFQYRETFQKR